MLLGRFHPSRRQDWRDLYHFAFPQLPVAIAVGGVTTFVLVLLFTSPIGRLRAAARQLAQGNLSARVDKKLGGSTLLQGNEFHALNHDSNYMAERLEALVMRNVCSSAMSRTNCAPRSPDST